MHLDVWQGLSNDLTDGDQLFDVNTGAQAHGIEHEAQVFHDDIARGTRCEGAAAYAGQRRVKVANATLQSGRYVGQTGAASVVKVCSDDLVTQLRLECLNTVRTSCGSA